MHPDGRAERAPGGVGEELLSEAAHASYRRPFRKRRIASRNAGDIFRKGGEWDVVRSEERREHGRARAAEGAVAGGVFREGWSRKEWLPVGVFLGGGIFVEVGVLDGSDGSPEVAGIFAVPAQNPGIGFGDVQEREEARVFFHGVATLQRQFAGDHVPVSWRSHRAGAVRPKLRDRRLLGGARWAVLRAEFFNLIHTHPIRRGHGILSL